jgi:signal transduction histidine kinase/CheY-like chemotaxis protein/streptogramin lyase
VSVPQPPHGAIVTSDGALWADGAGRMLRVSASGEATRWLDRDSPAELSQLRLDGDGRLWIGAANGVYTVDADRPRRVFAEQDDRAVEDYRSWRAPDGALWLSHGGRLWRSHADQGGAIVASSPVLTSSGDIRDVLFGDDDVVWVMTLHDGIYRLNRARVDLLDASTGIAGGNVYGVARDANDTLWLGSLGSGLTAIHSDGRVRHFGRADGLPGDNPWLVAAGDDGSIYVGTYAPGLWRRAPAAERFEAMALPTELLGEQVLAIAFDAAGRLWLGTTAGAWRRDGDAWQRQWPSTSRRVRVAALAMSGDGEVWFGGAEGVWRQQGSTGHAVAETVLARTSVRDLYRTRDGALWISTDGRGLVRVAADDPLGLRATQLGRAQGLPSNSPHTVLEDANGNVWVNSNQGIFRISRPGLLAFLGGDGHRLSPLVLGLSDGLTELEGNGGVQPAAAADHRGRLWFPSQRGVVRFDPLAMPLRENPPHAIIDGIEGNGQTLHPDTAGRLPLGVRSILLRYDAADLGTGSQTRFRYRLLPQNRHWTDAAGERSASFSTLQPGRYRFELLAGNSDGVWAETPAALDFEVPSRWHETRTFRGSMLAAAALLALALVRLRLRRLRLRAVELDRQVGLRTGELVAEKARVETALSELARTHHEIEDSNQRLAEQAQRLAALDRFRTRVLADVSHELRTPVMLVSLPLRELHAQAGRLAAADRGRLELSLRQLERLGGLVEQLLDLVQAEAGQTRLRLRRLDLAALLREIAAGYRPAADAAGIQLLVQGAQDGVAVFGDGDRLTTVFGNLLDNAIKYAPVGSVIAIRLDAGDEQAVVEVRDEGPGFDPASSQHLFQRFYRADDPPRHGREGLGIGLALARELVELHGGRIQANSTPGAGATFRVELPLGSAHVALDDLVLDPAPAFASAPIPSAERGDGRVLLVEDHPDLAAYLAERLGEYLPVTCVGSAEQALQRLADDPGIRLVVSDVVLPGASGLELCRQLAGSADERRRPVILISARAADTDREAGLAAGAAAYLAKPFSFESLLGAIAQAWPEAAPRLVAHPLDAGTQDPCLRSR